MRIRRNNAFSGLAGNKISRGCPSPKRQTLRSLRYLATASGLASFAALRPQMKAFSRFYGKRLPRHPPAHSAVNCSRIPAQAIRSRPLLRICILKGCGIPVTAWPHRQTRLRLRQLEHLTFAMLAYGRQKPAHSHFVTRIFTKILAEQSIRFIVNCSNVCSHSRLGISQ